MIVADTGALIALIDSNDMHHEEMLSLYEEDPAEWIIPWATLPEVDYLLGAHVSERAQQAFTADLAAQAFFVEWGTPDDLVRAHQLTTKYSALRIGLVDAAVAAMAERLRARAIATVDLRDFGAMKLRGNPKLYPRDWR